MSLALGNIAFHALSLTVLGVFCWMIHVYRAQVAECLKSTVAFSSGDAAGVENRQSYNKFLGIATTLGALSVGLGAVKVTAWLLAGGTGTPGTLAWKLAGLAGTAGVAGLPAWVAPVAAIGVALLCACVAFLGTGVLRAAGYITLSSKFTASILQTKRNSLATASIFAVPLVAMWTGINPASDRIVAYVIIVVTITLSVLFITQTLRGFIKQKVSLLVWFLYLCTVEIFPVCAVVLAAMKNV